jgi:hypothetical protein
LKLGMHAWILKNDERVLHIVYQLWWGARSSFRRFHSCGCTP